VRKSLPHFPVEDFRHREEVGYHSEPNSAAGVELPEKTPVREKHILELEQISKFPSVLEESGGSQADELNGTW